MWSPYFTHIIFGTPVNQIFRGSLVTPSSDKYHSFSSLLTVSWIKLRSGFDVVLVDSVCSTTFDWNFHPKLVEAGAVSSQWRIMAFVSRLGIRLKPQPGFCVRRCSSETPAENTVPETQTSEKKPPLRQRYYFKRPPVLTHTEKSTYYEP